MREKTDKLTIIELKDLKKRLRSNYFTGAMGFFMAYFFFHIIYLAGTGNWFVPKFEILVILGLLISILLITYFLSRELSSEIKTGLKIIEYKIIENKLSYLDKQDRLSVVKTNFVIIAENKRFIVSEDFYKKAEISDLLLIHQTPIRKEELKLEIEKQSISF
jgi:hypothetical protein